MTIHRGETINDVIKAVEKVQPKPITGGEFFRFLHPDEPEEDTGDPEAEEL